MKFDFIKNSKHKKHICFIFVVLIAFGIIFFHMYKAEISLTLRDNAVGVSSESVKQISNDIKNGDKVVQKVVSPKSKITGFSVALPDGLVGTDGSAHIEFCNDNYEVIYSYDVNFKDLKENKFISSWGESPLTDCENKVYYISTEMNYGNPDMVAKYNNISTDNNTDTYTIINGEVKGYDLLYGLFYGNKWFIKSIFLGFSVILMAILVLTYYSIFIKRLRVENLFLICSVFLGLVYLFVFPPFSIADEACHIGSSYRYANKLLGFGFGDTNYTLIRAGDFCLPYIPRVPTAETYRDILKNLFTMAPSGEMKNFVVSYAGNVMQYIMPTLGVTLARVLDLGFVPMLLLGRIFNFALFVFTLYFSIKIVPFGKNIFLCIALMPITLSFMMSFSYDVSVISLSMFFFAMVLHLAYGKQEIDWYHIFILALAGGLLVTNKMGIYAPICFTAFLISPKRFNTKKLYFISVAVVFITCTAFMLIFTMKGLANSSVATEGTVASNSFTDIINDPIKFLNLALNTISKESSDWFITLVGTRLSWTNCVIPFYIGLPITIILILSAFKQDSQKQYINIKSKTLFVVISLVVIGMFIVVAYTWNMIVYGSIRGLQGRYFIPILPLLLLLLRNDSITIKKPIGRKLLYAMVCLNVFVLMYSFKTFVISDTLTI